MKKILYTIAFISTTLLTMAQNNKPVKTAVLSVRGGIDKATKSNFTNFVNGKLSGINAGISYDKYWNWVGLGADIDFMQNEKPVYNDAGMANHIFVKSGSSWILNNHYTTSTSSTKLTRLFGGIGPSFKAKSKSNKFTAELALRVGITYTNGSSLAYSTACNPTMPGLSFFLTRSGSADPASTTTIQNYGTFYHDGYKNDLIGTGKAQLRLSYYVKPKLGIHLTGYYMAYLGAQAKYNYLDWVEAETTLPVQNYWGNNAWGTTPGNISFGLSNLSSYGITTGVNYRWGNDATSSKKAINKIAVAVKDELTGLPLSDVNVSIVANSGKVYTATTNATGIANFDKIADGSYTASGTLNDVATNQQGTTVGASSRTSTITLLHNDPRFTVQGKAINLGTTKPEGGVSVSLKNNSKGAIKMGTSQNGKGAFGFQIDANSDYELVGKKDNYISNIEKISTKGLNRSQTLYVQLELGVEEATAGKTIQLKNIYYDLDKSAIREEASSDLEKLVQFMQDNTTLKVEIASHTDSRGSDEYNLKLSQERAQAVVNYLTQKGINTTRVIAKGYGETKLINNCSNNTTCTEEQHQQNRRTEFIVIK